MPAIILAIGQAVLHFFSAFGGVTVTILAHAFTVLRSGVIAFARATRDIFWTTGQSIWHALKATRAVWDHVLRPALQWAQHKLAILEQWARTKLGPVFAFIDKLRKRVMELYRDFVRPVLDIIDITTAVLRVLARLHVPFAETLAGYLVRLEDRITANFNRLLGWLNEARDVLDSIVTPDRLLQRVPFIRSLQRDAGHTIRIWWNRQIVGLSKEEAARRRALKYKGTPAATLGAELGNYYTDRSGELAGYTGELVPLWLAAAHQGPELEESD
jgi:hypothetical protein